jgi:5'-nucleotidase (lipoprotein e(P4) family)
LIVGCASTTETSAPPATVQAATPQLDRSAHWLRNSAEYKALVRQTYNVASVRLREIAAMREKGTWAVALDADETIIDNSAYEKELTLKGLKSTDELWDGWVARRAAPPLPGVAEFLELVHGLGGYIAVVTNRIDQHCPDTQANFRAFDLPFDVILCRQGDRRKEPRWEMVANGTASPDLPPLEIVMWVGDNIRDFPELDQDVRFESGEGFQEFGRRYFALPNPVYGSWTGNPQD